MNTLIRTIVITVSLLISAQVWAAEATESAETAISGTVELASDLAGKVARNDTIFIFARAAQGPRMPLAVFKSYVMDLPISFTLDDSMAMRPQLKLSGFDQVVVVARVSKSGTPMPQSGDMEGTTLPIKPGTKDLHIVIDTLLP